MFYKHCVAIFLCCFFVAPVVAQDEKAFRQLFLYADREKAKRKVEKVFRLKARSNRHYLDFTGDNRPESFFSAKLDGEDWFFLFDSKGEEVFRYQFHANGPWSRLFKVQKRKLSEKTMVYLLYLYEGVTRYLNFQGTSRLYFLTIDENDLSTASIYKGPILWDENRNFREHYHQRKYEVSLFDLDKDLVRELIVKYGRMSRVYKYMGRGKWLNADDQEALGI